jgi:fatty acid desaturase
MTLGKFLLSSVLVSITFGIMGYVLLVSSLNDPNSYMERRGVLYLALLPYLLGALINKEGYWERSESLSELLYPPKEKKKARALSRVWRLVLVFGLVGLGFLTYQSGGYEPVKGLLLVLLGAFWGGVVTRAWFIYQESLTVASRRTR